MAKKVVATLKTGKQANVVKVIKAVKNDKTGSYSFKEEIVPMDQVNDFIAGKNVK